MNRKLFPILGLFLVVVFSTVDMPTANGADLGAANSMLSRLKIEFPFGKYQLPGSQLRDMLAPAASTIKRVLDMIPGGQYRVYVVGHTDNPGGQPYNKALSGARARVVFHSLVRAGVPKKFLEYVAVWNAEGSERSVTFKIARYGTIVQK